MPNVMGMTELTAHIDALTQKISARVIAEEVLDLRELISERAGYIAQLVTHYAADHEPFLKHYLTELKASTEDMQKLLFEQREAVRKTLRSLQQVKAYTSLNRSLL